MGENHASRLGTAQRRWIEFTCSARVVGSSELPGGAGARRYWRAVLEGERTAILMHAVPERPEILPPALRDQADGIPFVAVTAYLARHGVPVPRILGVEPAERWVLLEDLGDRRLCDLEPAARGPRLEQAVRLLAEIHALPPEDELPFRREFDAEWIRFELQTFLEHGLSGSERGLSAAFETLVQAVAALPRTLCVRDYQSQNLMIDRDDRLRILDYQDALLAPPELDLAALLFDSYIDIDPQERTCLLSRYAEWTGRTLDPAALALLVVQRKCKDLGRFLVLASRRDGPLWSAAAARAHEAVIDALPRLPAELAELSGLLSAALGEVQP